MCQFNLHHVILKLRLATTLFPPGAACLCIRYMIRIIEIVYTSSININNDKMQTNYRLKLFFSYASPHSQSFVVTRKKYTLRFFKKNILLVQNWGTIYMSRDLRFFILLNLRTVKTQVSLYMHHMIP